MSPRSRGSLVTPGPRSHGGRPVPLLVTLMLTAWLLVTALAPPALAHDPGAESDHLAAAPQQLAATGATGDVLGDGQPAVLVAVALLVVTIALHAFYRDPR